uniref:Uncharacterized protein n=1 Tax=Setaria viridis TaxID=4556 RepID=A0A4U6T0C4_SETVI|nr:hypothetical protein SEVIR_9G271400v2 [Setaria viridis]
MPLHANVQYALILFGCIPSRSIYCPLACLGQRSLYPSKAPRLHASIHPRRGEPVPPNCRPSLEATATMEGTKMYLARDPAVSDLSPSWASHATMWVLCSPPGDLFERRDGDSWPSDGVHVEARAGCAAGRVSSTWAAGGRDGSRDDPGVCPRTDAPRGRCCSGANVRCGARRGAGPAG